MDEFDVAFAIRQIRTRAAVARHRAAVKTPGAKLLRPDSQLENWLYSPKSEVVLCPANAIVTGKIFGYGIYFADQFSKSLTYTPLLAASWTDGRQGKANLAVYEVYDGEQFVGDQQKGWHDRLTGAVPKERDPAFDFLNSQRSKSLLKNEFIRHNQNTIQYLVRIKVQ